VSWIIGEYSSYLALISGMKSSDDTDDEGYYWMDAPDGQDVRSVFKGRPLHTEVMNNLLDARVFLLSPDAQAVVVLAAMKVFIRGCLDCDHSSTAQLIAIIRTRIEPFLQVRLYLCVLCVM
jgi:hypothetical protein